MADDMGYADLSCYGRRDYKTPNIDSLAAQGIRYTHAYSNSPVCSATRTALMTGQYQYRLPVGLEEPLALRNVGMPPEKMTLPRILQKAGYSTSLIGKWHLGALPDFGPLKSGYDHFWGFRSGGVDYFDHSFAGRKDLWDGETPIDQVGYLTDLIGDRAVELIDEQAKRSNPFFMSLHFSAPHWPWETPDDQAESDRLTSNKNPWSLFHFDGGAMETFKEMVTRLDDQVGRVLEALKKNGLKDDTIIVFTSDNGGERFSDNWPFTGRKTELLEGGIRIPAIVRWPGNIPAGTTNDQPFMSMDWLPTLATLAGNPDHETDGLNITPTFTGGSLPERPLFWRYKNLGQEACRLGKWKYLKIQGNSFLFDIIADPMERANLKTINSAKYEELVGLWNQWNKDMLPLDPKSFTHGFNGKELADHFGVEAHQAPPMNIDQQ